MAQAQLDVVSRVMMPFQFHEISGRNIQLSANRMTASRVLDYGHGIVMSSLPMEKRALYEVVIDEIDTSSSEVTVYLGVVTKHPSTIIPMPARSVSLPKAVIAHGGGFDFIERQGQTTRNFQILRGLKEGSRIGVALDYNNYLRVYMDGQDQGKVTPGERMTSKRPIYAMFDLGHRLRKQSLRFETLPVKRVLYRLSESAR